ncbi:hypothetical protein QUF63_16050 [Anaerolineales bacterium HSG25]|nr:hypothetical protein [Anaerolineales bacterium HSG25]
MKRQTFDKNKGCGGQDDVGVQWVQPLLLATAKPVALHFQHQSDHYT